MAETETPASNTATDVAKKRWVSLFMVIPSM
jgi:hypothetical protein